MCGCRVWVPYSANFIAMEIYLQRSNLGKAIINMHVNFKQKFKWFEHDQFQSTDHNQQLIISVSTIFPVHFVLLHKGFLWFLFILAFTFFESNIWTLPNIFHHLHKAPSQSHKWSGNFYKYLENRIKCSTCNKVYVLQVHVYKIIGTYCDCKIIVAIVLGWRKRGGSKKERERRTKSIRSWNMHGWNSSECEINRKSRWK